MLKPDLTTLRVFITVATVENITRASELVHIAPSAISKRLSDFEQDIGTKLFYRMHRGVALTPAGEAVLHYARNIFQNIEQLTGELSDYASGTRGHVRMVVTHSSVVQFLPTALQSFLGKYPDIKIELQEHHSPAVVQAVAEGRTDLGIAIRHATNQEVEFIDYEKDELVLIVPRGHALEGRASVRFEEALDYDFISVQSGYLLDTFLTEISHRLGKPLRIRFRLQSFDAIYRMVAADLGIGLGPRGMLSMIDHSRFSFVGLDESWAKREICIVVRNASHLSATAKLMIAHLTQNPDHVDEGAKRTAAA
jgi:DNA-binding transcriptional LysR family regulator